MADRFYSLINDPNFGRLFTGSMHFRQVFRDILGRATSEELMDFRSKLEFDIDEAGEVVLRSKELNKQWRRSASESMGEFVRRVTTGRPTPADVADEVIDTVGGASITNLRSAELITRRSLSEEREGLLARQYRPTREQIARIAEENELTIRYRTFSPGSLAEVYGNVGEVAGETAGLIRADTNIIRVAEMWDKNNNKLPWSQVMRHLGLDPDDISPSGTINKRLNALFNAPALQLQFQSGDLRMVTFEPEKYWGADALVRERTEHNARLIMAAETAEGLTTQPRKTLDDYMKDIYSSYTDGQVRMDVDTFRRKVRQMQSELWNTHRHRLMSQLEAGAISQTQFNQEMRQINEVRDRLSRILRDSKAGMRLNSRVVGSVDVMNGLVSAPYAKGDLILIDRQTKKQMLRRIGGEYKTWSNEEIDAVDVIVDVEGIKTELGKDLSNVLPFVTADPVTGVGTERSYTNTISMAAHAEMLNPTLPGERSFLEASFDAAWSDWTEAIRTGDIGGLRSLLQDIKDIEIDTLRDPAARASAMKNKQYALKIERFINSGGRAELDETMTRDLYRIAREHFFIRRRNTTLNVGGREIDDFAFRVPRWGSRTGHIVNLDVDHPADATRYISSTLGMEMHPDVQGHFGMSADTIAKIRAAMGGSDLDDALSMTYQYDPNTHRLLSFVTREPTAASEYAFMDAQLGLDKEFQRQTVDYVDWQNNGTVVKKDLGWITRRRKEVLRNLERLQKRHAEGRWNQQNIEAASKQIRQLNELNRSMESWIMSEDRIARVDLAKRYSLDAETQAFDRTYAPHGFRVTEESLSRYQRPSIFRSYAQFDIDVEGFMSELTQQMELERVGASMLPFEATSQNYYEMLHGAFGEGDSPFYRDFRRAKAVELAEAKRVADSLAGSSMTAARQKMINEAIDKAASEHLLERSRNLATVIDQFVMGNISLSRGARSKLHVRKFTEVMQELGGFLFIPPEQVIDPIVKSGDVGTLRIISESLEENYQLLGRALGRLGDDFGLDPVIMQQRAGMKTGDINKILAGYRLETQTTLTDEEIISRIALDPTDERAWVSRFATRYADLYEETAQEAEAAAARTNANLMEQIRRSGFVASAEERARAESYINKFYLTRNDYREKMKSFESGLELMQDTLRGDIDATGNLEGILADMTEDEINRVMVREMQSWNLSEEELARQMRANALVALERKEAARESYDALQPFNLVSTREGDTSIAEIFHRSLAVENEEVLRREILDLARSFDPETSPKLSTFLSEVIDPVRGQAEIVDNIRWQQARLDAILEMRERGATDWVRPVRRIAEELGIIPVMDTMQSLDFDELIGRIQALEPEPVDFTLNVSEPPGAARLIDRTIADEAASSVIGQTTQRRFAAKGLPSELDRMLSLPGFRKGLAAAGIFAGLGIVRLVRGERTPEQMQGPPLLPGGSAYETIPRQALPMPQVAAISNNGWTYKVRAQGNFDAMNLNKGLRNVTGSPINSTIYDSSQEYNPAGRSTAVDILNTMIG